MSLFRFISILALAFSVQSAFAQDNIKAAKIFTVQSNATNATRQFFGKVVAKETVDLAFRVGGQIEKFPVIEGEFIAKGDLIAELDREVFQLALDQARLQMDQSKRTLDRLNKLRGNTVSQTAVDDAKTAFELSALAVRRAERDLQETRMIAPFDALVASRNVANFSSVSAGSAVARLHDMSEVRIEIEAPEVLFQRAGVNPKVDAWAKFHLSDKEYPLEIREFNAEASAIGQTLTITFGMETPKDMLIIPGLSISVFISMASEEPFATIPSSAVNTKNDGTPVVMVFEPTDETHGTVSEVEIEIRPSATGKVEVISGLTAGQEIVASGGANLNTGDSLKRFTGFAN
ncbi:hemolysin D [Amylibacter ulvae]|uniref:Hemolysin D n=1 Tax=Paramylibacter ulvae TaxID=1651968 RepID=A0ABQ3CX39_9RHOB|nr:efflux RND transporter periplasmic adaptor subunit [Amylibacter ulvae]GHA45302.1 hemolysin D [Amylibacter ulvae]